MEKVLVTGSVILDIVATYEEKYEGQTGKSGEVQFSVGGAAFNIAANLAANNVKTNLYTYLSETAFGTQLLKFIIKQTPIQSDYIFPAKEIGESTYVAHFCGKDLKSGVTSSGIDTILFENNHLRKAIEESSIIIVETNLSTTQINTILQVCKSLSSTGKKRKVLASIVSAPKAERLFRKNFVYPFEAVSMNAEEALTIGIDINQTLTRERIIEYCSNLNSKNVFVTKGKEGYWILRNDGFMKHVPGWIDSGFISDLGAGDALFSAICHACFLKLEYDSDEVELRIKDWVRRVLAVKRSNLLEINFNLDESFDKQKKQRVNFLILFLSVAILLAISGFAIKTDYPLLFWTLYVLNSVCCGALGGIANELIKDVKYSDLSVEEKSKHHPNRESIKPFAALGALAGFLSSLVFLFPHLTTSNKEDNFSSNAEGLGILIFWIILVAFGAGLISERFISSMRNNADDLLNVK